MLGGCNGAGDHYVDEDELTSQGRDESTAETREKAPEKKVCKDPGTRRHLSLPGFDADQVLPIVALSLQLCCAPLARIDR